MQQEYENEESSDEQSYVSEEDESI